MAKEGVKVMLKDFFTAVQERRTYYGISKETTISDERIQEIIEHAVKHVPSAFNSQSARVVLLLGEQHTKLWNITKDALRKIVPVEAFKATEDKINGSFQSGYGTILFFEDQSVVESLQKQFPLYADNFPSWSLQASGMHQYVIWTALESEGLGASLQHYNVLIEENVKKAWNLPTEWLLIGQMPFGKPVVAPDPKEFKPLAERFKTFK